jgi:hypothetical protein
LPPSLLPSSSSSSLDLPYSTPLASYLAPRSYRGRDRGMRPAMKPQPAIPRYLNVRQQQQSSSLPEPRSSQQPVLNFHRPPAQATTTTMPLIFRRFAIKRFCNRISGIVVIIVVIFFFVVHVSMVRKCCWSRWSRRWWQYQHIADPGVAAADKLHSSRRNDQWLQHQRAWLTAAAATGQRCRQIAAISTSATR